MEPHTSANQVADYLIWLAAHECESDPDYLTPLKLQKLLYYVQGWALAEWDRPIFHETIEAWRDGPVVPEVYAAYRSAGAERRPIIPSESHPPSGLSPRETALIASVWDAYKRHSAFALRDLTHQEAPWAETYAPHNAEGHCDRPIPTDTIRACFRQKSETALRRLSDRRADLRALAQANTIKLVGRRAI